MVSKMADEQNQSQSQTPSPPVAAGSPPPPAAPPPAEDVVKLSPAQYNALLDKLDELEDLKNRAAQSRSRSPVDQLADEGRQRQPIAPTQDELEQLRPQDLVNYILGVVNKEVSQPMMVKIEEIRVKDEIRELMRDEKNKDFWDYKESIYQIAVRNPNLSIEEAYKLAKSQKGPAVAVDSSDGKDTLRSLPSRRSVPVGERPGLSGSSISKTEPETRKEAAQMAWDKMKKEGKVT
jgi:hypothetical protein